MTFKRIKFQENIDKKFKIIKHNKYKINYLTSIFSQFPKTFLSFFFNFNKAFMPQTTNLILTIHSFKNAFITIIKSFKFSEKICITIFKLSNIKFN